MEAMASGLPCLVGNIRGNVDLVDKQGGFLFEPGDVESIRDAVQKMIDLTTEERQKLGYYILSKIKSFNLSTVEGLTSEIYRGGMSSMSTLE